MGQLESVTFTATIHLLSKITVVEILIKKCVAAPRKSNKYVLKLEGHYYLFNKKSGGREMAHAGFGGSTGT